MINMQIPDLSEFKGKEFIFDEDFLETEWNTTYPKGMRFKITSIKKGWVTFKVVSTLDECMGGIQRFANNLAIAYDKDIPLCEHAIKLWETDPDGFEVIPEGKLFHRSLERPLYVSGKMGYDVYTRAYERKDGELNHYGSKSGLNVWYNKEWYERSLECNIYNRDKYAKLSKGTIKEMYSSFYKGGHHCYEVKRMNMAKFSPVENVQVH